MLRLRSGGKLKWSFKIFAIGFSSVCCSVFGEFSSRLHERCGRFLHFVFAKIDFNTQIELWDFRDTKIATKLQKKRYDYPTVWLTNLIDIPTFPNFYHR